MDAKINRRNLLGMGALMPLAQGMLTAQSADTAAAGNQTTPFRKTMIEPFDYTGVTLRQSPWQRQASAGRDFYYGLSNDDILHGYRVASGTAYGRGPEPRCRHGSRSE